MQSACVHCALHMYAEGGAGISVCKGAQVAEHGSGRCVQQPAAEPVLAAADVSCSWPRAALEYQSVAFEAAAAQPLVQTAQCSTGPQPLLSSDRQGAGLQDPCPCGRDTADECAMQARDSQMLHQAAAYLLHDHFAPGSQDKYKTASAASFRDLAR